MPRWLVKCAFNVILLSVGRLCAAQSPSPQLWSPPPPPPRPQQNIPLYYLDFMMQASLCSRVADIGCMGEDLQWLIDLEPFPLTTGTSGSPATDLDCIGSNDTGCKWRTIQDYRAASGPNTDAYFPLGLTIQAKNITRMFMLGHVIWGTNQYSVAISYIMRQLKTLTITCTQPIPVFAPYVLEPLIMALSGAVIDLGWNATSAAAAAAAAATSQGNSSGGSGSGSSTTPSNTTSDATTKPAPATFSRLYKPPTSNSSQLRSLIIQDCGLTGQLPPASFWLQLPALEHLDLSRNQLSGPLPATFGPSPPLSYLNLSYNRISGPLTASLARYGGCGRIMDLSYNDLRGNLPDEWLSSACTLRGKSQSGSEEWLRRRRLLMGEEHETGPDGGVAKVSSSPTLSYRAVKPLTAVTEGTTPSTASTSTSSDSYAFWLTYPMSYMYGGDDCPLLGIAWRKLVAARVMNGGTPFNFTVLLYGNSHLSTPGGTEASYATAAKEGLQFRVRDNACTIFEPLSGLLWVWCTFGGAAVAMLIVALVQLLFAVRLARMGMKPDRRGSKKRSGKKGPKARARVMPAEVGSGAATVPVSAIAPAPPAMAGSAVPTSGADGGGSGGGHRRVEGSTVAGREGVAATVENQFALQYGCEPGEGDAGADTGSSSVGRRQDGATTSPASAASDGGSGGGGMARLIIVAHARLYSANAARRLSSYGSAVINRFEAFCVWIVFDIPWAVISRAVVAITVHLSAAGLTFAMSQQQRTAYCGRLRQCGTYLYIVPPLLSAISIGLTVFLMKAMRQLARSMASRVAAVSPDPGPQNASGKSGGSDNVGGSVVKGDESASQFGVSGEEKLGRSKASSNDGEATEPRMTPPTPAKAPRLQERSSEQLWVSGLQPRRSGPSPPTSNESQQASSEAGRGTMPLFEACPLPVPASTSGMASASSRGSSKRVTPTASSQATAHTSIVSGGGSGPPVRPLLGLQSSGGGPVAESLAPVETDLGSFVSTAAGTAATGAAAVATGQAAGRREQIAGGLYGKPAEGAPGPLLPASPYGPLHQHAYCPDAAVPAVTRARASLESIFSLSRSGSRRGCVFSPGVVHDPEIRGCDSPGSGLEPLTALVAGAAARNLLGATRGPGSDDERARQCRVQYSLPIPVQPNEAAQPHGLVGTLTWHGLKSPSACGAVGEGIEANSSNPCSSASSYMEVRDGGNVAAARSGDGPPENPDRTPFTASARRTSLRPSPIAATHGISTLGSATSVPSVLPPGSLPGASTGFDESESSLPYMMVEPMRGGRAVGSSTSTSTHGSRRLRVVVEPKTALNECWCNDADLPGHMHTPTAVQQAPTPPSVSRIPDSPTPKGLLKRGNTWLEDRLAALATLSTTAPAPASVTAVSYTGMPSVAAAAAVAAGKPRKRSGGTAAGADRSRSAKLGGTPSGGGMQHLQPEALQMVNQYLRDYTFGKKGSGWVACVGRTLLSVATVLLIFAPLAPLAAAAALLAALVIIIHGVMSIVLRLARTCARFISYSRVSGGAAASLPSRSDQRTEPLRLSVSLFLVLHTHVAAWVICGPLGALTGVLYGLGYLWGKDAVPMPWVWLSCNSACLAGVLLVLLDLAFQLRSWERGVCSYPYAVVLRTATAAPDAAAPAAGTVGTRTGGRNMAAAADTGGT
ncbi:hypothetical protein VaNZ11_015648 [Volvox africanus]|uniref:GP46-like surface antigen n=1 Tax=Volvox africanus TaxID=51714 RepID=A0ABQ5SM09_9CHLO|nr:hypothetical protein VaNZ11_015648 [Volvox africanus]